MIQNILNKIRKDENLSYIFNGGSISFIFKILGVLFGFLVIWIISRLYNESFYGTFALLQVIVQLLVLVFTFGLQNILVKEINKKKDDTDFHFSFLWQILKKVLFLGLFPSLIIFIGSHFISEYFFLKPNLAFGLQIMGMSLLFFLLHEITLYFFIARKEFVKFGLFMFVMPNVLFIAFILALKNKITDENHLFLYYSISFLLCFVLEMILIYARNRIIKKTDINWTLLLKESNPIMLSSVTFYLLSWVSVIILGRYVTESQIGIYNAAYKIGLSVQLFMLTINIIISPRVADLYHREKYEELKKFIHHSTRIIALVTLPVALIILVFNEWLMSFFGTNFIAGSTALIILTVATFINAVSGNVDQILYMTDNQKIFFKIIIVSLIANIIINLVLIPRYGINGAAIANLITTILMNFLALMIIKRKLGYFTLW